MLKEINESLLDVMSLVSKKTVIEVGETNECTPCENVMQTFILKTKDGEDIHINMFEFAARCKMVAINDYGWEIHSSPAGDIELVDRYKISDNRENDFMSGIEILSIIRALKWIKNFEEERESFES